MIIAQRKISITVALISAVFMLLSIWSLFPVKGYAVDTPPATTGERVALPGDESDINCKEGIGKDNCGITKYIIIFINVLSAILGIVITISIIVAGIQYSASAGNPQAVEASKKRISNAILALVVFAFMFGFLQWIVPGGVL